MRHMERRRTREQQHGEKITQSAMLKRESSIGKLGTKRSERRKKPVERQTLSGTVKLHGLHTSLNLPKSIQQVKAINSQHLLPTHQSEALQLFEKHPVFKQYFGADFMQLWCACKKFEHQSVLNKITDAELEWGL